MTGTVRLSCRSCKKEENDTRSHKVLNSNKKKQRSDRLDFLNCESYGCNNELINLKHMSELALYVMLCIYAMHNNV